MKGRNTKRRPTAAMQLMSIEADARTDLVTLSMTGERSTSSTLFTCAQARFVAAHLVAAADALDCALRGAQGGQR